MIGDLTNRLRRLLSATCPAAYLYGSQCYEADDARDVDIVLVCPKMKRNEAIDTLAGIQEEVPNLLHAIFVSPREIEDNPQLQDLVRGGRALWTADGHGRTSWSS